MLKGDFMSKFVCIDCGAIFEEPQHWEDRHGFDYGPFEEWSGCPYCGGAYAEAHECDCCGEWITGGYIKTEDEKRYCGKCYATMELGDEH